MSRTSLDELFPLLAPHLPGVPNATMRLHLAAAAAEFCAATHLWRETLYEEQTIPGIQSYPLLGSATVESVLWIVLDQQVLRHIDPRFLDPRLLALESKPQRYWVNQDQELCFNPIPDAVYPFSGELALKPSRDATAVPSFLCDTWGDALVDGAIWRISSIPGKSWTALDLATMHKQRFDRAKANAMTRDYRQIELRVQPVRF